MKIQNYLQVNACVWIICGCMTWFSCDSGKSGDRHNPARTQTSIPARTVARDACEGKARLLTELKSSLKETSGLAMSKNYLWTHNDRGGENKIYAVDTLSGQVIKSVTLEGVENTDWEDLATSNTHLYVGDMGNNKNDRTEFTIYRIPLSAIDNSSLSGKVRPEPIVFTYLDQDNVGQGKSHNFDCEAIIYANEQLYLFTKNRSDKQSNLYALPARPGKHVARKLGNFAVNGLITGAAINPAGDEVALVGYNKKDQVFIWLLTDFTSDNFFSGNQVLINLGAFSSVGQAEGICYLRPDQLLISSEKTGEQAPRLYHFTTSAVPCAE
jgi:hypothetical protein